jgi:hypothetical protein
VSICLACGRCCFGPRDYVQIFDEDLATLGPGLVDSLGVLSGTKRFMRMEGGHCVALRRSGAEVGCSIYERRPLICRVYAAGGEQSRCAPVASGRTLPQPSGHAVRATTGRDRSAHTPDCDFPRAAAPIPSEGESRRRARRSSQSTG